MDRKHILVGEDFFRSMMRIEEERKRCFAGGNLWRGADGVGTRSSNIVSLEQYRREQRVQSPTGGKPTKPAA
jgi:hypothetical protein